METSIIRNLTSTTILYNECTSDIKFAFKLFDLFIVRFTVNHRERTVCIDLVQELHELLEFGTAPDEELPYSNITEQIIQIVDQLFNFVCDKINSLISEIQEKFDLKTIIGIWHTELYGLNDFILTIRNIYNTKIKNSYISSISVKSNILEK